MLWCGGSPAAVEKMYFKPTPALSLLSPNPLHKSLARLTVDFHKNQLLPGRELDVLAARFLQYIEDSMRWEKMTTERSYVLSAVDDAVDVSLLNWCGDILVDAGTRAYWGERLLQIEPNLLRYFFDYDDRAWMLLFQYPRILSKDMYAAKGKIINALSKYYKLPKEERSDESWFVRTLEAEQRQIGIGEDDIAAIIMIVYWASVFSPSSNSSIPRVIESPVGRRAGVNTRITS